MIRQVCIVAAALTWWSASSVAQSAGYWVCEGESWKTVGTPTHPAPDRSCAGQSQLPDTEAACKAESGSWARGGLSPVPLCIMPTSDAGRPCGDARECEGTCVVSLEVNNGPKPAVGFCSERNPVFGCLTIMLEGRTQEICID